MKKFLDYCFYRAAAFYKEWHDYFYPIPSNDHLFAGARIAYGSLMFLSLTVLMIVTKILFGTHPSKKIFFIIGIITVFSCFFFGTESKFVSLKQKYKYEKNKKMKGWLVVAYWIGSWTIAIITAIVL